MKKKNGEKTNSIQKYRKRDELYEIDDDDEYDSTFRIYKPHGLQKCLTSLCQVFIRSA